MKDKEVAKLLRAKAPKYGHAKRLAFEIGTTPCYLRSMMRGDRAPSNKVLKFLGLKKVICYEPE